MKTIGILLLFGCTFVLFARNETTRDVKDSIVYECVQGLNTIALPLETGFETMADVAEELQTATEFSRWNAVNQKWKTTAKSPYGVWVLDFNAEPGIPLMVKNNAAETFTLTGSPFFPEPTYQIYLARNFIVAPLSRPDLTTSALLGNDLSNANQIAKWNSATQNWIASNKTMFGTWISPFPVYVGMPLFVRTTNTIPYTWPNADKNVRSQEEVNDEK
jgi:hypothetical protein